MLRFLPMITSESTEMSLESSLKYFIIQRLGSITYLRRALILSAAPYLLFSILITVSILLKLGAAPLHGWFIRLLKSVSVRMLVYLSTVQKVIPLIIVGRLPVKGFFLWTILISTLVTATVSGFSTLSLNGILGVSSINNLVWLILAGQIRFILLSITFSIYRLILIGAVKACCSGGRELNFRMGLKNLPESYCLIFSLISLGGVPPFLGFLSKVLVLKRAFSLVNISFLIILALASLNILVFYMRLVISASLVNPSVKIQIKGPGLSYRLYVHISIIFIFNIAVLLLI